jgi:hypothetical protein
MTSHQQRGSGSIWKMTYPWDGASFSLDLHK